MISVEIPQKQEVELLSNEHTGTYPILSFSEGDVRVLKLQLHPEMAERVGHLPTKTGRGAAGRPPHGRHRAPALSRLRLNRRMPSSHCRLRCLGRR